MLLTKKNSGTAGASSSPFVHSLRRGLTQALPTLDRRTFLRRSGLGVGVGLAASQLSLVKKAQAGMTNGDDDAPEVPEFFLVNNMKLSRRGEC